MFAQILILALSLALAAAFSIPGFSTAKYKQTEVIPVFANELDSIETQLNFDYYYLPFCKKEGVVTKTEETLGGALLGETKEITPYQVVIDDDPKYCKQECKIVPTLEDVERFQWLIDRNYSVNLVLDELPAIYEKHISGHLYSYHVGYPIGEKREEDYYIYNHVTLKVTRTPFLGDQRESRILEFGVIPTSLDAVDNNGTLESFCAKNPDTQVVKDHPGRIIKEGQPIFFSYDVIIIENNTKQFASRWDHYHKLQEGKVHWMYLISSFVISILLAIMVGYILKRTVNNDIRMYNELRTSEEIQEDSGWKQLARDVFRPPKNSLLLSVFIGTGVQVGSMLFLTLGFATIGFMDHSQRGSLLTTIILLYNFMGAFAGYYSSRFYKMFNGSRWVACTLLTALLYPSINFGIFYVINIMLIFEESSAAVHIGTILELLALWLCISMPLVFFGSLIGYKKQQIKNPSKFNPIPKFIKQQPWYLNSYVVCLLGGFLPFGAIFMEYMSIMLSVWKHWFYYLFIFLFAIAIILVATCAEISIVITYLQLCSGNHRVWWRSFLATGSMAIYIFAYSIFYYFSELKMERFSSIFLYFGYMFAFSLTIFILCGTIGFVASYVFVRKIYASIKID